MQPSNPQRPVMDISAPRRPATPPPPRSQIASAPGQAASTSPSSTANPNSGPDAAMHPAAPAPAQTEAKKDTAPALSVHEPPQNQSQPEGSEATPSHQDSSPTETKASQDAPAPEQPAPAPTTSRHPGPPLPVGAIVGAIFVMAVLAAAAILVYVQTQ